MENFKNYFDFAAHLQEVKENSRWHCLSSDNVVFEGWDLDKPIILKDYGKPLYLPIREETALPSIFQRCQVFGESLRRLLDTNKLFLSEILTKCLQTRPTILLKMLEQYGEVSALHSSDYAPMDMVRIFEMAHNHFEDMNEAEAFEHAKWDFGFCTAEFKINNSEISDTYKDALERNQIISKGTPVEVSMNVRLTTSDVATSGVNLTYKLLVKYGQYSVCIPLTTSSSNNSIKHIGNEEERFQKFEKVLSDTLSLYKNNNTLLKMMNQTIYNPINCLMLCLKSLKVPIKYSKEIVDHFEMVNGNESCSAYEVYSGACYLLELISENSKVGIDTLRTEETLCKLAKKNFSDFDVAGNVSW